MPYKNHGTWWHTDTELQAKLASGETYPNIFADDFDADVYIDDLESWYVDLPDDSEDPICPCGSTREITGFDNKQHCAHCGRLPEER